MSIENTITRLTCFDPGTLGPIVERERERDGQNKRDEKDSVEEKMKKTGEAFR